MTEQVLAAAPTAGELLRQAREAAGLHVAALAVSLKVPVRKLEALEADHYEQLPDAVFARALASAVCRALKIDPRPVLDRLPQSGAPRLLQAREGLNTPFRAPGDVVVPAWREHLMRPVSLAVGVLLVGALVIALLPTLRGSETMVAGHKPEPAAAPMAAPMLVQAAPAGAEAPGAAAGTATAAAAGVPAGGGAAAAPLPAQSTAATPASASHAVAAGSGEASATAPGAQAMVTFRTTGPSWIEVVDSQGRVPLRRLLAAGETVGAAGSPPLAVTVGNVNTTAVDVRGKRFELAPLARDNVARFEVR